MSHRYSTPVQGKRMRSAGFCAGIFALAMILSAAEARAAGNAEAGHALAQLWCSSCHLVDGSGRGGDTAPPFATIATSEHADNRWLRGWLTQPHPPMPNLNLSRVEIDDVIAYLNSLAAH